MSVTQCLCQPWPVTGNKILAIETVVATLLSCSCIAVASVLRGKTIKELQHLELISYYCNIPLFIVSIKYHEANTYANGPADLFRLTADVDEMSIALNPLIRVDAK
jgi:hypothetical protein